MDRFNERGALVVGGASGIGRAIAERLSAEGAPVAVADRNVTGAQETSALVNGLSVRGLLATVPIGSYRCFALDARALGGLMEALMRVPPKQRCAYPPLIRRLYGKGDRIHAGFNLRDRRRRHHHRVHVGTHRQQCQHWWRPHINARMPELESKIRPFNSVRR